MEKLIIKKTEETPAIILNPAKKAFQIVGTAWPENAKEFFDPVFDWLSQYFQTSSLTETIFDFRLEYINTASSKQIARLLTLIKSYCKSKNVKIRWFYEKGDFDMNKEGRRFAQILEIDIDFIEK